MENSRRDSAGLGSLGLDPSYVLRAMEVEGDPLYGAVRLSFDRKHSLADIATAVERIVAAVQRIRELVR